jgi:hypothetical protein
MRRWASVLAVAMIASAAAPPAPALAVVANVPTPQRSANPEHAAGSLESAAERAGNTGRAVAMSLVGLALAVAGIVLAFRRDFKEAAGVFAVGIVSVLLATPTGVSVLRDTVTSLFGAQ